MAKTQNSFTYNGVNSYTDLNLKILESNSSFQMPIRDISQVEVPARSGLLLQDNNRWKEKIITYKVMTEATTQNELRRTIDIIKWKLTSNYGEYKKLTDTISLLKTVPRLNGEAQYPMYRLATFIGGLDWETTLMKKGVCDLSFIALPQDFIEIGSSIQNVLYNELENGTGGARTLSASALPRYTIYFKNPDTGKIMTRYKCNGEGDIYLYTFNSNPSYENRNNAVGVTHIHLTNSSPFMSRLVIDTLNKEVYDPAYNRSFNSFTDLSNWAEWPELNFEDYNGRQSIGYLFCKNLSQDTFTKVIPTLTVNIEWRPYMI